MVIKTLERVSKNYYYIIRGYIKDMLKDFLPIENSDDWIMSILSNNIKVDKDGEETLEICGVMG